MRLSSDCKFKFSIPLEEGLYVRKMHHSRGCNVMRQLANNIWRLVVLRHAPTFYVYNIYIYVKYIMLTRKQSYPSRCPHVGVDVRSPSKSILLHKNDA